MATAIDIQRAEVAEREKARCLSIMREGHKLGATEDQITLALESGEPAEKAIRRFAGLGSEDGSRPGFIGDVQPTGAAMRGKMLLEAISLRLGQEVEKPSADAKVWAHRPKLLLSAAKSLLQAHGRNVDDATDEQIASMALCSGNGEWTAIQAASGAAPSDFPTLLGALIRRSLEGSFGEAEGTYHKWAKRVSDAPDLRPWHFIQVGEFTEFPELADKEEFKESTTAEEVGWMQLGRYGDEWGLSPVMIVNDDLGALADVGETKRAAHDATLNRLCVNLLTTNAIAPDGTALFHADHGNIVTAGAAPSVAQLDAMRLLMRRQKGISNLRAIGMNLGTVLVPSALETATEQTLRADLNLAPATDSDVNPFRKDGIQIAVEPMLEDKGAAGLIEWYGFTSHPIAKPIIYAHQSGYGSMNVRSYVDHKTQCRFWQFEGRFAAAIRGFRGVVRNAGTGA